MKNETDNKFIDLHTHSTASDGTFNPEQIIQAAIEKGLAAISITDHDTIDGLSVGISAAHNKDIIFIPGVEISADYKGHHVHILGYGFTPDNMLLLSVLKEQQDIRAVRNLKIVDKLVKLGFDITIDEAKNESGGKVVGRPHIAKVLKKKGYVKSGKEAFTEYLDRNKKAYVERERHNPEKAIQTIHEAGGIAIIAHPCYFYNEEAQFVEFLSELIDMKADGFEAYYTEQSYEITDIILSIAKENDLIVSGGSDFHGSNKKENKLGYGFNGKGIPHWILEPFLKKCKNYY